MCRADILKNNMKYTVGLLGKRLSHSLSPQIHKLITGGEYGLFEREENEVGDFVKNSGLGGFNVTVPYKKTVVPFLDAVSDEAKRTGAVNTVVNRGGVLTGCNTDVYGFKALLEHTQTEVCGKRAVILGSGGAAAAVKTALTDLKAGEILTVSRTGELNYENVYGLKKADILINATPVGMFPHEEGCPVDLTRFENIGAAVDLIYNPLRTRFTDRAQRLGIKNADGLYMLVAQAVKACELFHAAAYPDGFIDRIYSSVLSSYKNLALIGMPGAGKSGAGKMLAEKTGRVFFDADELITEKTGKTPEQIIKNSGEAVFRRLEKEVIAQLSVKHGIVIATGGGAVTTPENLYALRKNSTVVFIDRPPGELEVSGRPLSERYGVERLYKERLPLYKTCADITVKSGKTPEETAETILKSEIGIEPVLY